MGPALLALIAWAGAPVLQDPAAPDTGALWKELMQSWGDRFRAVKAERKDPALRAAADVRYQQLVVDLEVAVHELATPLHYEALSLGKDPERLSDVDARLRWLEVASDAARLIRRQSCILSAAQARGELLKEIGRLAESCQVLEQVRPLVTDPELRAQLEAELAERLRLAGEPGRALAMLDELEARLAREGLDAIRAKRANQIELTRFYVYLDLGLPDRGAEWIRRRLQAAEAAGKPGELLDARLDYAQWLLAVGDQEGLVRTLGPALVEAEAAGAPSGKRAELAMLLGTAEVELELEDPAREPRGEEHLARAIELGLPSSRVAFARLARAEIALAHGRTEDAARELSDARTRLELGQPDPSRLGATLQAYELVTLEARLALARSEPPEALALARERLGIGLETMLAAWAAAPIRAGGVGWLQYSKRRALVGEYTRLSIALEGEETGAERGLERLLAFETCGTLARRAGVATPTLAELRRALLAPGRGILIVLSTRVESHVFALDQDGLIHASTGPSYVLEAARRAYLAHGIAGRDAVNDPARRAWALEEERRLARELAALILPERIRARIAGWREVTVAGTDSLGVLPIEWLPLGDEPYLGAARAVDFLPSMPLGVSRSRRPLPAEGALDLLLVGETAPSAEAAARWPGLELLPLLEERVGRIAGAYPRERVGVLRGAEASCAGLAQADLGATRVLQLLVHGVLDRTHERPLTLLLSATDADPGFFRCENAESLRAPPLVVLASCRTGAGPVRKGDAGMGDMGGAWLGAGAQAVVLARDDLTLEEVTRTSAVLHERLARGASPAEALRAARAAEVEVHGAEAPFHSGLLTVVGLGQRPIFSPATPRDRNGEAQDGGWILVWTALGAGMVGLVLGAVWRRGARI